MAATQKKKLTSVKILITCQFLHFVIITALYVYSVHRINRIGERLAKNHSVLYNYKPKVKREAVAPVHPDDLSQWTILLGHDTIIPVSLFDEVKEPDQLQKKVSES